MQYDQLSSNIEILELIPVRYFRCLNSCWSFHRRSFFFIPWWFECIFHELEIVSFVLLNEFYTRMSHCSETIRFLFGFLEKFKPMLCQYLMSLNFYWAKLCVEPIRWPFHAVHLSVIGNCGVIIETIEIHCLLTHVHYWYLSEIAIHQCVIIWSNTNLGLVWFLDKLLHFCTTNT